MKDFRSVVRNTSFFISQPIRIIDFSAFVETQRAEQPDSVSAY